MVRTVLPSKFAPISYDRGKSKKEKPIRRRIKRVRRNSSQRYETKEGAAMRREEWGSSKLDEFRIAVKKEFGANLEKATPANVREFMDRHQENLLAASAAPRFELNEPKTTYEEILKDFFLRVLESPSDEALIMLWTLAFEMSFFNIEQHAAERLQSLFGEFSEGREEA